MTNVPISASHMTDPMPKKRNRRYAAGLLATGVLAAALLLIGIPVLFPTSAQALALSESEPAVSAAPVEAAAVVASAIPTATPTPEAPVPTRAPVRPEAYSVPSSSAAALSAPPTFCLLFEGGEPVAAEEVYAEDAAYLPHVWPVIFSEVGYISSRFGLRTDPITGAAGTFHAGIDLADRADTKILAAGSGIVKEVGESEGYGVFVLIDHGNGYRSRYSHCSAVSVEAGQSVEQGQVIALMGQTGRATGVHCDFRIYLDGTPIDPLTVLDQQD